MKTTPEKKRIAIIVPNPCNPDYRVIRQAETLAAAGHDVRIFATLKPGIPAYEEFNGVSYVRSKWSVVTGFLSWFTKLYKLPHELNEAREEHFKILEKIKSSDVER